MVAQGRIENYEKSGAELKRPRPRHTHTHTRRDLLEPPFPSLFSTSKKEQRVVCVCVCVRQRKNVDTIRSHHSAGVVFYWSNHSTHHKIDTSEQPIPTRTANTTARLGPVKRETRAREIRRSVLIMRIHKWSTIDGEIMPETVRFWDCIYLNNKQQNPFEKSKN